MCRSSFAISPSRCSTWRATRGCISASIGRREQVDHRLLGAAETGAVAARERQVVRLVEQQRLERADPLPRGRRCGCTSAACRQVEPEVPLLAQPLDRRVGLAHRPQRVVLADLDALHAALAGVGVDGDREQPAAARLVASRAPRPVRARQREAEADRAPRGRSPISSPRARDARPRRARSPRSSPSIASSSTVADRVGLLRRRRASARRWLSSSRTARGRCCERLDRACARASRRCRAPARPRSTRPGIAVSGTDRVALAARGAVLGDPLRMLEADRRHVAEERRATPASRPSPMNGSVRLSFPMPRA